MAEALLLGTSKESPWSTDMDYPPNWVDPSPMSAVAVVAQSERPTHDGVDLDAAQVDAIRIQILQRRHITEKHGGFPFFATQ
jgi:hypothetical protein